MYQYVIFDLDGTLLNTLDDLTDAGNWVCRNHGWPTHSTEEFKYFVGNGLAKMAERFAPEDWRTPEKIQKILNEFTPYYDTHKADKTAPYEGMPHILARLKEKGICMSVLSNKAHPLAGPVVEHYYPGLIPMVQGAVPGVATKPDPTLLHRLMDQMGAVRENTLFVGDSNVDIRTAKNGNLTSCGVLWGFRNQKELQAEGADFIVDTPEKLEELILK